MRREAEGGRWSGNGMRREAEGGRWSGNGIGGELPASWSWGVASGGETWGVASKTQMSCHLALENSEGETWALWFLLFLKQNKKITAIFCSKINDHCNHIRRSKMAPKQSLQPSKMAPKQHQNNISQNNIQWRTSSAPLEGKIGAPLAALFLVVLCSCHTYLHLHLTFTRLFP